jgi:hypothetical protein
MRAMKMELHATYLEIHVPKYFRKYWTKRSYYRDIKAIYLYRGNLHFFEGKNSEFHFNFSPLTSGQEKKFREIIKILKGKDIKYLTRSQFYSYLFVSRGSKKQFTYDS